MTLARPGVVEARQFLYKDSSGLTVATTAASVDQRVSARTSIYARAVADYIHLERRQVDASDPSGGQVITGHRDADVVTSASALPSAGGSSDKWRAEVAAGGTLEGSVHGRPASAALLARVSIEPDYRSYAALARTSTSLRQQNLTLSAFAGFGHDDVVPALAPPGQAALWPASHERVTAGVTGAQVLSPRVLVSAGAAASRQHGQLASPYRRALVRTTLFPEVVPGTRVRATGFVAASAHVGAAMAVHVRLGGYADSWNIQALIPEVALSTQLGPRWLVYARYRFYAQTAARFYQPLYADILPTMSGDPRAGAIRAHAGGVGLELDAWTLSLVGSYDLSVTKYPSLGQTVLAHVASLGVIVSY
jgi:uncharacterized protein DUF3570